MFGRMLRTLAITVAALPLALEPALAAPPAVMVTPVIQSDVVPVGMRACTPRVRTNCFDRHATARAQRQRDEQAGQVIGGLLLLGAVAGGIALANRGGGHSYRGDRGYARNYDGGGRRGGGRRFSGGGGGCNQFYTVPNPNPGQDCY